ncbi:MAG: cation transporter [Rhodospirillales bacterium]|nr:cation transporter [Rhodospirillales bacterium]
MNRYSLLTLLALSLFLATSPTVVFAQSVTETATKAQTTTFVIENMTCALCPITVRKAMEGVKGVQSVKVNFDKKTATVTFDPTTASATIIATASTEAGYPAKPGV